MFLKGCPLSCEWCHNPESQAPGFELIHRPARCIRCGSCVDACPQGAIAWTDDGPVTDRSLCIACGECADACVADARQHIGREVSVDEVVAEAERDRAFYEQSGGGVTLTGGEPLFQREFTPELLAALKARGLHTALDTCGAVPWSMFERVRRDVDLFLYDLKLFDDRRHRRFTGASNGLVLANLRALTALGHRVRLRVPLIPGFTDDEPNLSALAAFAATLPRLEGVDLLPYHAGGAEKYVRLGRSYALEGRGAPSGADLRRAAVLLAEHGLPVAEAGGP